MNLAASPDFQEEIVGREVVPGNPNVVRVLFRHRDALVLPIADWVDYGLKIGLKVPPDVIRQFVRRANMVDALQLARVYLTGRVKTSAQVTTYLQRKGVDSDAISDAIRHLEQIGALDDEAYAVQFVEVYGKRTGRQQLYQKLLQRGIPRDIAKDAVASHLAQDVEMTAAIEWANKYIRRHGLPEDARARMKMMQHLARKGCPSEIVRRAVEIVLRHADGEA
ncbi:regulatory protein RecX [Alicyclobacillus suci]|uniref:regulatory protein RecX n=1 Tax=Alicyclobacillus suci TaxID=2816080 RepID=UPI0016623BF2|nr:regulatory protein RecX [Alicyclobacillus suci]